MRLCCRAWQTGVQYYKTAVYTRYNSHNHSSSLYLPLAPRLPTRFLHDRQAAFNPYDVPQDAHVCNETQDDAYDEPPRRPSEATGLLTRLHSFETGPPSARAVGFVDNARTVARSDSSRADGVPEVVQLESFESLLKAEIHKVRTDMQLDVVGYNWMWLVGTDVQPNVIRWC